MLSYTCVKCVLIRGTNSPCINQVGSPAAAVVVAAPILNYVMHSWKGAFQLVREDDDELSLIGLVVIKF